MTNEGTAAPRERPARVTLTLDGEPFTCAADATLMEALDHAGLLGDGPGADPRVPSLCWHPGLRVPPSCRVCRVEVEGEPDLQAACTLPVREGLVVRTDGERVRAGRRHVLEMHLSRHPLDCPICDRSGDCALQRQVDRFGPATSRERAPAPGLERHTALGAGLVLDRARCVHCERCVRFCEQVTGTNELVLTGRGDTLAVAPAPGREVANPYALNLAELCPVGAITRGDARPRHRPWQLASTPSVCGGCGRGCNVWIDTAERRIVRLRARRNDHVNGSWLCDAGRLDLGAAVRPDRIRDASIHDEHGRAMEVPIEQAIEEAAGRLAELVDGKGAGVVAGLASAHQSNESLFAFKRLLDDIGTDHAAVAVPMGEGDERLVVAEKAANARGATALGFRPPAPLLERLRGGGLDALIVIGHDLLEPGLLADPGWLGRLDTLILIDDVQSALVRHAHVVIPSLCLYEERGSVTNVDGRVQRIEAATQPDFPAWSTGAIVRALGLRLELPGYDAPFDPAVESARIGASVPDFAGRGLTDIGTQGLPLAGVDRGGAPG